MIAECPKNPRKPHLLGRVLLLYAGTGWVYAVAVAFQQVALSIRADLSQTRTYYHHGRCRESV